MKMQSLKFLTILAVASAIVALGALAKSPESPQRVNDFKITERMTVLGQSFEITTMIKGARERSERHQKIASMPAGMNMDMIDITQCDMRRTIQINDRARKYLITPMESENSASDTATMGRPATAGPPQRGGTVTYVSSTSDTGERKQVFGFTARHLKSTMSTESSPDACSRENLRIERDGWYINLNTEFSCAIERPLQVNMRAPRAGCQDRVRFRRNGAIRLGYPIQETTTIYGGGEVNPTITKEVIELSRQPLEAALFDVPSGYTEARSQQEMYAAPSMAEIMKAAQQQQQGQENPAASSMPDVATAGSGELKIGVVQFNNKSNTSVSSDELRDRLISQINSGGVEAIPLNASSLNEAQTEAKVKGCSFILLTDISSIKNASAGKKLGGIFGRATGADTGGSGKSEAKFDFKLYPTGNSSPAIQSSATGKEDNQDASVNAALEREAQAVVAGARKN